MGKNKGRKKTFKPLSFTKSSNDNNKFNTSAEVIPKAESANIKKNEIPDRVTEVSVDVSTCSASTEGNEMDCQVNENTLGTSNKTVTSKIKNLSVSSCTSDSYQKIDVSYSGGDNKDHIECRDIEKALDNSAKPTTASIVINKKDVIKGKNNCDRYDNSKKKFKGNLSNYPQRMSRDTTYFEKTKKNEHFYNQGKSKSRHNTHLKNEQPTGSNNSKPAEESWDYSRPNNVKLNNAGEWDTDYYCEQATGSNDLKPNFEEESWDDPPPNNVKLNNENLNNAGEWDTDDNSEQHEENCASNPDVLNVNAQEYVPSSELEYNQPGNMSKSCNENTSDCYFNNNFQQNNSKGKANNRSNQLWGDRYSRKSFPTTLDRQDPKRYSDGKNKEGQHRGVAKDWRNNSYSYDRRSDSIDNEYKAFCDEERNTLKPDFIRVNEIEQDLFAMPKEYSLGHCVAEDLKMGSGIAVSFKREFKAADILLNQRQKQGGLAVLEVENDGCSRYIYYLVTKRESNGKPTYEKFWSSVQKMRDHIRDNNVKKLAIPRLGCGLDRLEWDRVKHMLEFLFKDLEVEITVCNFQQTEESPEKPLINKTCKVVYEPKPLVEIEEYTTILYLSSEDGHVSPEMEQLANKFLFLNKFKRESKLLGNIVRYEERNKNYILYGCIVRKTNNDPFDFVNFKKCLTQINRNNKKDQYEYVGIQAIKDERDDLLMEKITMLLRNTLVKVDIYVCGVSPTIRQR